MGLLKKNILPKSLKEIHREKTRQLKTGRAELDRERERFEQNSDISTMEAELAQVRQSIENFRVRNKKRWRMIMITWGIAVVVVVGGRIGYYKYSEIQNNKELERYKQQLEAEFNQYNENAEIQKRELQLQIDELTDETEILTQQLKSLY